jgi:peptidoglycan/xylan/chitin deacetylase (PgdA/CDA1 family)
VPIDPRRVITSVQAATWFEEKPAACSLEFDDTRASHLTIAAPELEARGFRGTFNLVTGRVEYWSDWQMLLDHGHEIANHTRNHLYFSQIPPEEAKAEISLGVQDILDHLIGLTFVPSFVYPGGDVPPWSEELVALYHICARGGQGVESADPEDILRIKGCGYYYPFSLEVMNSNLDQAIASGGWYIPYYHSFTSDPQGSHLYCPRQIFTDHLDYVARNRAELWIAPQGEVARYILERQTFRYRWTADDEVRLWIETGCDPGRFDLPLTLLLQLRPGLGVITMMVAETTIRIPAGTQEVAVNLKPGKGYSMRMWLNPSHPPDEPVADLADRAALGPR